MIDRHMHEGSAGAHGSEEQQSMRRCEGALGLMLAVALGEGLFNEMVPQQQMEGRKGRGTEGGYPGKSFAGRGGGEQKAHKKMMYVCNNYK